MHLMKDFIEKVITLITCRRVYFYYFLHLSCVSLVKKLCFVQDHCTELEFLQDILTPFVTLQLGYKGILFIVSLSVYTLLKAAFFLWEKNIEKIHSVEPFKKMKVYFLY